MALSAQSLHKLERQFRQHWSTSSKELVNHYVVEQQALVRAPTAHVDGRQCLVQYQTPNQTHDTYSKHRKPDLYSHMDTDTPQKEADWLGHSAAVNSAQRGHRKRPRQENSSNSSIIQCVPSDTPPAIVDSDFGDNEQKLSGGREDRRRIRNFQKLSRHKMRERAAALKQPPPTKQKDKTVKSSIDARKRKKDTSEAIIPKNRSDILAERFTSENVANPRITLRPSHRLGIFKKGREAIHLGLPDLCFSEMPPVDRYSTAEIGVYHDDHSSSIKRGQMPFITQPQNLLGRLPPTDVSNVDSTLSSINLDSLNYISEVGPYDSISQASSPPSPSVRQPNISNERSALSNFGDETRPHSAVSSTRLSIHEDGVQSTARASANVVASSGTTQQTTTAIQDHSESDVANAAVARTGISKLQQTDAAIENEVSYSKQQQISYEKEPGNIASNDALSQLEQLLRMCDWSRTTLAPHMSNDFELSHVKELSPTLSRTSGAVVQLPTAKVDRYDRMDNLDHVVVHTESEYQSRQMATTENATVHPPPRSATDDNLIGFDNRPRVSRNRAHCDNWYGHQQYIYDHAGNISTSVGSGPRIIMHQSHDSIDVNDSYNDCNGSSRQDQYIGDQEKVSEPESDLSMAIHMSENSWNVGSEYSDGNRSNSDDGTINNLYREHSRNTRVYLEEQYGGGDVYPYQTILRGSNMVPRNFWRPHRLS